MSDKADFKRIEKYQKAIDADRKAGLAHWQIAQKYGVDLLGTLSVRTRNCLWAQDIYNEPDLRLFIEQNGGASALRRIPYMGAGLSKEVMVALGDAHAEAPPRRAVRHTDAFMARLPIGISANLIKEGLTTEAALREFINKHGLDGVRKIPNLSAARVRQLAKALDLLPERQPAPPPPTPEVEAAIALLKSNGYTVSRKKPKAG